MGRRPGLFRGQRHAGGLIERLPPLYVLDHRIKRGGDASFFSAEATRSPVMARLDRAIQPPASRCVDGWMDSPVKPENDTAFIAASASTIGIPVPDRGPGQNLAGIDPPAAHLLQNDLRRPPE